MKYITVLLMVLGIDLATKRWANEHLLLGEKKELVKNRFYFWHIKNDGIAYHKFSGERGKILLGTGGIIAFYFCMLLRILLKKENMPAALPLSIMLGGALGNFFDRLKSGKVTDFLYVNVEGKRMPIFNVADVGVVLGAVLLLFSKEK